MTLQIVIFAIGLLLVIKGGDLFVSSSVRIAEFLKMPHVVIGSTLVSLATTSPELVVSIMSGIKGESGLAVGNAVGSCVCNIALILGLMATLKHIRLHPKTLAVPLAAMCVAGVLLLLMTLNLKITRVQGLSLIGLGVGYFIYDFRRCMKDDSPSDVKEATEIEDVIVSGHRWLNTPWGTAAQFLCGAVVVVCGSGMLVEAAVNIATSLGVPTIVIGLSIVAVGTSLPELVTAISSSRQNVSDLAVGNVANLTLIVGSAASIQEMSMSRVTQLFNFPALLLLMALVAFFILRCRGITRSQGVWLLGFYVLYVAGLVILTVLKKA
jgi:cation:H+ antiporter